MNEKELIRTALETRTPSPLNHSAADIITQEAQGAQAHIRKRRFVYITSVLAAALLITASVFTFKKLGDKTVPTAAHSDSSDASSRGDGNTGKVIKLCDFTGTDGPGSSRIQKEPENLPGYKVNIYANSLTAVGEEHYVLIDEMQFNTIVKVYSADVTGDGFADICAETKPSKSSDESIVYFFDLKNKTSRVYYVPGIMSFTLEEKKDTLMLGMRRAGSQNPEYVRADFTEPEQYGAAKLELLDNAVNNIIPKESDSVYFSYTDLSQGQGRNYLGKGVYNTKSNFLFSDYSVETNGEEAYTQSFSSILSFIRDCLENNRLTPAATPVYALSGFSDETLAVTARKAVSAAFSKDTDELSAVYLAQTPDNQYYIELNLSCDRKSVDYLFKLEAAEGIDLMQMFPDNSSSSSTHTSYYCSDITAADKTSAASRMLIPPSGDYAIAYHLEAEDNTLKFVIDDIQLPEGKQFTEGFITVNIPDSQSYVDQLQISFNDLNDKSLEKSWVINTGYSEADSKDSVSVEIASQLVTDTANTCLVTNDFSFNEQVFEREYEVLADFTGDNAVTRLSDGSQIRFDRYLSVFPDAKISITDTDVTVVNGEKSIKAAENVNVRRVFAQKLDSDDYPEIIVEYYQSDPLTDGTLTAYNLMADELLEATDKGIYLDTVPSSLSVYKYSDGTLGQEHRAFSNISLSNYFTLWDTRNYIAKIRKANDYLDELYDSGKGDELMYSYLTLSDNYEQLIVDGVMKELPLITETVNDVLDKEDYEIEWTNERLWGDISYQFGFNYHIVMQSGIFNGEDLYYLIYSNKEGRFYLVSTSNDYYNYDTVVYMRLPERVNKAFEFMQPDKLGFQSIISSTLVRSGKTAGIGKGAEKIKLENEPFELHTVGNKMAIKGNITVKDGKLTLETEEEKTAPGIDVEQSEIIVGFNSEMEESYAYEFPLDNSKVQSKEYDAEKLDQFFAERGYASISIELRTTIGINGSQAECSSRYKISLVPDDLKDIEQ